MGSVWLDELDEELDEELELLLELDDELLEELDEELLLLEELLDEPLEELDEELLELDEELFPPTHLSQAVNRLSVVKTDKKTSKNFFISCLQIFAKTALRFFCYVAEYTAFFVL